MCINVIICIYNYYDLHILTTRPVSLYTFPRCATATMQTAQSKQPAVINSVHEYYTWSSMIAVSGDNTQTIEGCGGFVISSKTRGRHP